MEKNVRHRCRGAGRVRLLLNSPPRRKGGAGRQAQILWLVSLAGHAGASRRANRDRLYGRRAALSLGYGSSRAQIDQRPVAQEKSRRAALNAPSGTKHGYLALWERPGRATNPCSSRAKPGRAKYKSSASSWRGLIVDPGGAPAPPG